MALKKEEEKKQLSVGLYMSAVLVDCINLKVSLDNLYCDLPYSAVSWYFIDWVEMTPTPTELAQGKEKSSVTAVVVNKVN